MIGPSSMSVVMWVIRAKFFTRPQAYKQPSYCNTFLQNDPGTPGLSDISVYESLSSLCFCRTGQVLLRSSYLSFRSVRRTQHPPLRRLQGARPADLPGLLKLGGDPGHHAESWDVGETGQNLGDALTVHLEPLQRPVALLMENNRRSLKNWVYMRRSFRERCEDWSVWPESKQF